MARDTIPSDQVQKAQVPADEAPIARNQPSHSIEGQQENDANYAGNNGFVDTQESESQMAQTDIEKGLKAAEPEQEPPYTTFTNYQKIAIVTMASLSSFLSPLSSTIYFPALNDMASYYHVSPSLINLTITTYQIFQGLSPAFYGDFADQAGRRPAFLTAFAVYLGANIGLALQSNYAALMILRCLQSAGSSGTIALSLGVIADVTVASERGLYMGFAMAGAILASAIGPIVGGLLSQFLGWRAIFWFLVIFSGCFTFGYGAFMPETSRKIVGNGSIPPKSWWNESLLDVLRSRKARNSKTKDERGAIESLPRRKVAWPRPWRSLQVMKEKDVAIVLFFTSIATSILYAVFATIPLYFQKIYGFNEVQIGLCYIPLGIGCFAFTLVSGRIVDWNFRRIAKAKGVIINDSKSQDLRDFPIEKARLQVFVPTYLIGLSAVLCYGWVLSQSPSLAAPLVLQFLMGGSMVSAANVGGTLLVDMYPDRPSMVSASNNMARCLIAAGATALVQPMIEAMGLGWTFTFFAGVGAAATPMVLVLLKFGPGWREKRRLKIKEAVMKAEKS